MTPKSLLRHKRATSSLTELAGESSFHRLLWDDAEVFKDGPISCRRIPRSVASYCCTARVYYDLLEEREKRGIDDIYLLRIEQLYVPGKGAHQRAVALPQRRDGLGAGKSRRTWGACRSSTLTGMGSRPHRCKYQKVRYTGRRLLHRQHTGLMSKHLAQLAAFLEDALGE